MLGLLLALFSESNGEKMELLLYSTNPYVKYYINEKFYQQNHYIWCSEVFDGKATSSLSTMHGLPASSNPADICDQLNAGVATGDKHCNKIIELKASIIKTAQEKFISGVITDKQRDEIIAIMDACDFNYWRPILYLVPRNIIEPQRLELVSIEKRASIVPEYIIKDLHPNEFEIMEM